MVQATELAVDSVEASKVTALSDTVVSVPQTDETPAVAKPDTIVRLTSAIPIPAADPDTVSAPLKSEVITGMLYQYPEEDLPPTVIEETDPGISYILGGLFLLFLVIALRFRNNIKYAVAMFQNLIETRTRQNVFNDTVRETSLIVLLNVMWCACAGIIGYCFYQYYFIGDLERIAYPSVGMLLGMALALVYSIFMCVAYSSVGWIFSDREHAELWVKGYSSSQALMAPAFFIIALVGICRPATGAGVTLSALMVFFLAKLVFVWKGYRIFFNQFSSWVLFLCYLCSLEIVPLILSYRCALIIGSRL